MAKIVQIVPLWIEGTPLHQIELLLKGSKASPKCEAAREWALRFAPEFAYFFSLVTQIYKRMREADEQGDIVLPLGFTMHGRCMREGFDTVEKLALYQTRGGLIPRVPIHEEWELLEKKISPASEYESFGDLIRRVAHVV